MANCREKLELWIPTTCIFSMFSRMRLSLFFWRRLGILRCCRSLETSSIKSTDKVRRWYKKTNKFGCAIFTHVFNAIARSFCYSTFLLLDVYSPRLLLAVSVTRHFLLLAITQHFLYSTYPRKGTTCNGASAYGTPLDGATVKVVITTVNKT